MSSSLTAETIESIIEASNLNEIKYFIPPIRYGKVIKVYDGDTIHIATVVFNDVISKFRVRINGVDTPELRSSDPVQKQAAYTIRDLLHQKIFGKMIELLNVKYDKYGRILADIVLIEENLNISQWLLESGYAAIYNGKGCKQKIDFQK